MRVCQESNTTTNGFSFNAVDDVTWNDRIFDSVWEGEDDEEVFMDAILCFAFVTN